MVNKDLISEKLYKAILEKIPVVCVDLIVMTDAGFKMAQQK